MGGEGNASPEQVAYWEAEPLLPPESFADKGRAVKNYLTGGPSTWLYGNYSYSFLCMPSFCPWLKSGHKTPPFYEVNEPLPIPIALLMGLQHALAMVGGLVVPPLLIGSVATPATQRQLINAAMICSGLFTLIHVVQFPLGRKNNWVYGSGLLSCTGISFTFLTPTQSGIRVLMAQGDTFSRAYGKCLGTLMVCSLAVIGMSLLPPRVLRRLFPPLVPGTVIFLIGAQLIQSAFQNWGGGAYCQEYATGIVGNGQPTMIPCITGSSNGQYVNNTCYEKLIIPGCTGNGNVALPYGSPQYIGLGFVCTVILIFLELFGSPVMRNAQIIIALLLGYLIAAVTRAHGNAYVTTTNMKDAPGITFLWVQVYSIGIYGPLVLPYLVGMIVLGVEVIGDVTATAEVSRVETAGPKHRRRIKGALLADGFNCFFAACAMTLPVTTFAQNNGVINITRCSSRMAGIFCGLWLIVLGIIAPIGAFFTSIPNCVLGGVTAFLFANVAVSGIKIVVLGDLQRRNRFILSMALSFGLGTMLVPNWATNALWPITPGMSSAAQGFRNACIIVLESGYSIGFLTAVILHLILPLDEEEPVVLSDVKKGVYDPTAPRNQKEVENGYDDTAHPQKAPGMHTMDSAMGDFKGANAV